MSNISVMLKTIGGTMCLVSVWLLLNFVPIPIPPTYVNDALAASVVTSLLVGLGLIVSARMEEW